MAVVFLIVGFLFPDYVYFDFPRQCFSIMLPFLKLVILKLK